MPPIVPARLIFRLRELAREMWVRVTLFSLGGVVLALISPYLEGIVPYQPKIDLASGAVGDLLDIVASSMLAVTTFSMAIIVQTLGGATSNATPRATKLLAADPVAQTAVAIFVGSFLFSIVGIIGLSAGYYPDESRVLLFFVTLGDIVLIVWALLRWVDHLNGFGRLDDILARIERAATGAAAMARDAPALGAVALPAGLADDAPVLRAGQSGYVRHIDMAALDRLAAAADARVEILRMPGKFAHEGEPLLRLSRPLPQAQQDELRDAFTIGDQRSFEQDPAFGLIVLSEVASKALSPAVNDPGTAIAALRAGTRVLRVLHAAPAGPGPAFAHVHAPGPDMAAIYRGFFSPIARDGAALFEVQETLQDCLAMLSRTGGAPWAQLEAERARRRADAALSEDWERDLIA